MTIIKLLKSIPAQPKSKIRKLTPLLEQLENDLREIEAQPNYILGVIKLFQVISPLQDEGRIATLVLAFDAINYGQLNQPLAALQKLDKQIQLCGRVENGWNRTEPGEAVTAEKVYLGGVFGIWTHPASKWLNDEENMKGQLVNGASRSTWYCINDYQCGNFLAGHIPVIKEQITTLKEWVE